MRKSVLYLFSTISTMTVALSPCRPGKTRLPNHRCNLRRHCNRIMLQYILAPKPNALDRLAAAALFTLRYRLRLGYWLTVNTPTL